MNERQLELFEGAPPPVRPAAVDDATRALATRLPARVRLGTSSWSFPGWRGLVYADDESEAVLARHGLAAYAQHPLLRAVGLDRTYYAPLSAAAFAAYARQVPEDFRFLVKAPQDVTSASSARFLDALFARESVLEPAREGLGSRLGAVLFQFSPGCPLDAGALGAFLERLAAGVPVAVEIRDGDLFGPAYAAALRDAGAVPGYVVHPLMPDIAEQFRVVAPGREPLVVRWMLGHGRHYEAARDRYAPFDRIVDPDDPARDAIAGAVEAFGGPALVIVNNKAEGSSPLSVLRLARRLAGSAPA